MVIHVCTYEGVSEELHSNAFNNLELILGNYQFAILIFIKILTLNLTERGRGEEGVESYEVHTYLNEPRQTEGTHCKIEGQR